jgi:hypothetical protein
MFEQQTRSDFVTLLYFRVFSSRWLLLHLTPNESSSITEQPIVHQHVIIYFFFLSLEQSLTCKNSNLLASW